ncbi:hypothetical protein EJ110_NYTH41029 [Nymphaea thermarum]|nr:hypothetical protein EJ110_NYTH41029 [Nymphaea thermarum]
MYHLCCGSYSQKAELLEVCWLQIRGTFDTATGLHTPAEGLHTPAEDSVSQKNGTTICSQKVHLNPGSADLIQQEGEDWLKLEVGRFQPAGVSREITFNLLDGTTHWKTGLVFAGVEIGAIST